MTSENIIASILSIFMLFLLPSAKGQVISVGNLDQIISLDKGIQLSADATFDPYQFDSDTEWTTYDPEEEYIHQGIFWVRMDIDLKTAKEVMLYLDELQEVQTYVKFENEITFASYTGVLVPMDERTIPDGILLSTIGNSAQERIPLQQGVQSIYLRINNTFEKPFIPDFRLYNLKNWGEDVQAQRESTLIVQGIIGGALLLISIYHLLIFIGRRDMPYLWYASYTFLMFYGMWIETGVIQNFFMRNNQFFHHYMEMTQLYAMVGSILYFMFMRSFIQLDKLLPKLDKFILWYLLISSPLGILMDLGYLSNLDRSWLSYGFIPAICTLTLGLVSVILILRTKDTLAYYVAFGSLVLYTFVMSNTIISFLEFKNIIEPVGFDRMYLTEVGVLIEIVIFSLGLGYRMRIQQREKRRIQDLDELKSKFFTNISHEFRTPLTIISGMTDQIKGHTKEKELIQRNSKNLLQLVNQLLDLSQLESKTMSVKNIQADIIPFLQYLTESFYSMAREKDIRLTFYPEVESQIMDFDENKAQQLIYNLLINAIKYTDAKGKVIVHVNVVHFNQQSHLSIKVKDTGHGITEKDIPQIFDRFYQTDSSIQSATPGTGIGLALTKEIVYLLHGDISVQSKLGEGSEFKVILPITQSAKAIEPDTDSLYVPDDYKEQIEDLIADDRPILLLVEDNPDIQTYLQTILKDQYSIHIANDGEEGIERAYELIPDIVISDVMMPRKDGYQLCSTLKSDERTNHIPIILLTAKNTDTDKISGLDKGADAYLTKPFNKEELLVRIKNLLEIRHRLHQRYKDWNPNAVVESTSAEEIDPFFEKIIEVINDKIDDNQLGVNHLCAAVHLSRMQVNRKVKALTGKSPGAFINHIRLEKAKDLLKNTDRTVSEVAYDVGYSDPNYFSRAFSKAYGHPPSEERTI